MQPSSARAPPLEEEGDELKYERRAVLRVGARALRETAQRHLLVPMLQGSAQRDEREVRPGRKVARADARRRRRQAADCVRTHLAPHPQVRQRAVVLEPRVPARKRIELRERVLLLVGFPAPARPIEAHTRPHRPDVGEEVAPEPLVGSAVARLPRQPDEQIALAQRGLPQAVDAEQEGAPG
jgi:hypothetical protein